MKKVIFCLIPALCLLASCQKERSVRTGGQGTDKEVQFKFPSRASSRATVVDDAISTLDVMLFLRDPADPTNTDKSQYICTRYAWQLSDGSWRTTLPLETAGGADIYFAVNAHTLVTGLVEGASPTIAAGMTYAAAKALLVLQAPSNAPGATIGDNGLPMWGCILNQVIADKPLNDYGTIYLLRAVASTDITVSDASFTLQQGILCYAADQGYLPYTPSNTTAAPTGGFQANGPEVPAAMTSASTADWTYDVQPADANAVVGVFYMYENDAPVNTANTSTKVVLAGVWNNPAGSGNTTYYPLALKADDGTGTMVKSQVVRNNKYIIIVSKVLGDGYPTLDQAKSAEEVNMDYQVIPWNANQPADAIIDGTQYVFLSRDANAGLDKQAVLYRPASSTDMLAFSTNIPLTSFVLSLDNGGQQNVAYVDATTTLSNADFSVSIQSDASDNTWFSFTALNAYNAASTDNPSTLTVTAGRISFQIVISQQDDDPNDWIDGGSIPSTF